LMLAADRFDHHGIVGIPLNSRIIPTVYITA
jgi:hypothetical protein